MRIAAVVFSGALLFSIAATTAAQSPSDDLESCLTLSSSYEVRVCVQRYELSKCAANPQDRTNQLAVQQCVASARSSSNGADQAEALRRCVSAASQQAAQRNAQQNTVNNSCRIDAESKASARIDGETRCVANGAPSACAGVVDEKVSASCLKSCVAQHESALKQQIASAQSDCERAYVTAHGRGKFACSLGSGAGPIADKEQWGQDFQAAWKSRDGQTLDALMKRSDTDLLARSQADCTKACNERGPNLLLVHAQGDSLVRGYKLCMVAADSSAEARKLDAYEKDLYCDFIAKADHRCRAANKCDLVEGNSALVCEYVSPGVGICAARTSE